MRFRLRNVESDARAESFKSNTLSGLPAFFAGNFSQDLCLSNYTVHVPAGVSSGYKQATSPSHDPMGFESIAIAEQHYVTHPKSTGFNRPHAYDLAILDCRQHAAANRAKTEFETGSQQFGCNLSKSA